MQNFQFAILSGVLTPPVVVPQYNIYGAGLNNYGECALNGNGNQWQYGGDTYMPYMVPIRPGNGFLDPAEWKQVHCTSEHTLAIKNDGTLWACGQNSKGQLGLGDNTNRRTLTQVGTKTNWVKAQAATEFSAVLDADGNIWTCGDNAIAAQLNDGTTSGNRNVFYNTSLTSSAFHPVGVKFVDLAATHRYVMALDENGDVWTWGNNGSRQLGRGSPGSAAGVTADPTCAKVDVPGPFKKILSGDYHGGAIHEDGTVWMWGLTGDGQRANFFTSGNNTNYPQAAPVNDSSGTWKDVNMGQYNTFFYRQDGEVFCCGRNTDGQLGLGDKVNKTTLVPFENGWKSLVAGLSHTFGIKADGTLWGCGLNNFKQLGHPTLVDAAYTSFIQISTDTTWQWAQPARYSSIFMKNA